MKYTKFYTILLLLILSTSMLNATKIFDDSKINNTTDTKEASKNSNLISDNQNIETNTVQESTNTQFYNENVDVNNWYQGESVKVDYQSKNSTIKSVDSIKRTYLKFNTVLNHSSSSYAIEDIHLDTNGDIYALNVYGWIEVYDNNGTYLRDIGSGTFVNARSFVINKDGYLYVADTAGTSGNGEIFKYNKNGTYVSSIDTWTKWTEYPWTIVTDSNGYLYFTSPFGASSTPGIMKITTSGTSIWNITESNANTQALVIGSDNYLYSHDQGDNTIKRFGSNDGSYVDQWSRTDLPDIRAMRFDEFNNLYLTDNILATLSKFDIYGNLLDQWYFQDTRSGFSGSYTYPYTFDLYGDKLYIGDSATTSSLVEYQWMRTSNLNVLGAFPTAEDNYDYQISHDTNNNIELDEVISDYTFFDTKSPSKLGIKFAWDVRQNSFSTDIFNSTYLTLSIDNSAIYGSGELKIRVIARYNYPNYTVSIEAFDTGLNEYISNSTISAIDYDWSITFSSFRIDYIWAESQEISSNIRSNLKYSNPTQIIHSLVVDIFDYRIPLAVYTPLSWNYTSVTPSASVTWDSSNNYWHITNTVPTTYTILFISGPGWGVDYARQSQYLAISDVSTDYMRSPSFESGSNFDWLDSPSYDSVTVNTSIVFDGSFSLRLSDTDSSSDNLKNTNSILATGEYYISFSYYIESFSGTSIKFNTLNLDGSTYNANLLDTSVTNRWQTMFVFAQIDSSTNNLQIKFESGQGVIFIDNFHLMQANSQITHEGYNHNAINYQIVSNDGYKFPVVPNLYTNATWGDRTAQTDILTKDCYTNSEGICKIDLSTQLPIKEQYINVTTSTNSTMAYFTPLPAGTHSYSYEQNGIQSNLPNYHDFSEGTTDGEESGAFTNTVENGYLKLETSSIGDKIARFDFSETNIDETYYDTLILRIKANITVDWRSTSSTSIYFYDATSGGSDYIYQDMTSTQITTSWQIFEIDLNSMVDGGGFNGGIGRLFIGFDIQAATEIKLDYWYLTNSFNQGYASEFEETESDTNGTDGTTIQANGWTQGDDYDECNVQNSEISCEVSTNFDGIKFEFENSIILNEYYFYLKIKSNDISTFRGTTYYQGGFVGNWQWTLTSEYQIIKQEPTSNNLIDTLYLWTSNLGDFGTFTIDFVRIVARTSGTDLNIDETTGLSYFSNDNNSTEFYQSWINGSNYRVYSEYELFYLPLELGMSYTFSYALISSTGSDHVETINTIYEYDYTVDLDFVISIQNFESSSIDESLTFSASKGGTVTIYENESSVYSEDFTSGMNIINTQRDLSYDVVIYYAAYFENGSDNGWFNTTIVNPMSPTEENLTVEYFYRDVNDLTFTITFGTNWGNQTATVYQNGTNIGTVSEDVVTVFDRPQAYDSYYNITIEIGAYSYQFGFYNAPLSPDIQDLILSAGLVHFDLVNPIGIGIAWERVKVLINDSRIYSANQIYNNGDFLNITVETFGDVEVLNLNTTVTASYNQTQDISLTVNLYQQFFNNKNLVPIEVEIKSGSYTESFVLNPDETRSYLVIQGTYDLYVTPLVEKFNNGTHILDYDPLTLTSKSLPLNGTGIGDDGDTLSFSLHVDAKKIGNGTNSNFWLWFWLIVTALATLAVSGIMYKLAMIVGEYTGISIINTILAVLPFTQKQLWSPRNYVLSERKPRDREMAAPGGYSQKRDDRYD